MAAKKKKKVVPKASGKQIRKQLKGIRASASKTSKGLSKSIAKSQKKLSTQNTKIQSELAKLREDLNKARAKPKAKSVKVKRQLSMYNIFVGKQIKQGKTFKQAVNAWNNYKKILEKPVPKRRKKKSVPAKKVRRVRKKTKKKKPAPKRPVRRRKVAKKPVDSLSKIVRDLSALRSEANTISMEAKPMSRKPTIISSMGEDAQLSPEEVAVRLTRLYFEEIARLGFKRRLDFDSIINAYYYCLQRLHNKDKEMMIMSKIVEREEAKMAHETKSELFPSGGQE